MQTCWLRYKLLQLRAGFMARRGARMVEGVFGGAGGRGGSCEREVSLERTVLVLGFCRAQAKFMQESPERMAYCCTQPLVRLLESTRTRPAVMHQKQLTVLMSAVGGYGWKQSRNRKEHELPKDIIRIVGK
jgi:hypothetical protein